jgi:hypothetical protein
LEASERTDGRELKWAKIGTENKKRRRKRRKGEDAANDDIIDPVTTATAAAGLLHIKWSLWSGVERIGA